MDEILQSCRNLCSDDFKVRSTAYQALRNSPAFTATMYRFRESNLTAYDLARLLASACPKKGCSPAFRAANRGWRVAKMALATDFSC